MKNELIKLKANYSYHYIIIIIIVIYINLTVLLSHPSYENNIKIEYIFKF